MHSNLQRGNETRRGAAAITRYFYFYISALRMPSPSNQRVHVRSARPRLGWVPLFTKPLDLIRAETTRHRIANYYRSPTSVLLSPVLSVSTHGGDIISHLA